MATAAGPAPTAAVPSPPSTRSACVPIGCHGGLGHRRVDLPPGSLDPRRTHSAASRRAPPLPPGTPLPLTAATHPRKRAGPGEPRGAALPAPEMTPTTPRAAERRSRTSDTRPRQSQASDTRRGRLHSRTLTGRTRVGGPTAHWLTSAPPIAADTGHSPEV